MRRPRFGHLVHDEGVSFRVWAPAQTDVSLVFDGGSEHPMGREDGGFFGIDIADAQPGQRYWFRLRQGLRPDPASRCQPHGPLGPSQIVDGRGFGWTDGNWPGIEAVHRQAIYEMHIGTFTCEGTWAAARDRLPRLAEMGLTTLEVMPIAEFSGTFGWGYDGVDLFAPSRLYGTPDDVRAFVDRAHALGLAVILDVVYNHFGPVGNYIADFSPTFLGKPGEWGDLFNFDGPGSSEVREFVKENAAYWIREFHFDGLRLDATQAIHDTSPDHIVSELSRAAREAAGRRSIFMVGESEPQDTRLLRRGGAYRDGLDAIWSEDWHHAAFVAATGRRDAYFTDYQGTAAEFASMARHGTLYQGQWYTWQTNRRGGYAIGLPPASWVNFLENHDQVANTGVGNRLHQQIGHGRWRALTALLLLGPTMPMLFQGQEFGATTPFTYFADHEGEVAKAVETGRLQFLTQFPGLSRPEMRDRLPRPCDRTTFERCRLRDDERNGDSPLVRLHQDLLRLRREDAVLSQVGSDSVRIESSAPAHAIVLIRYIAGADHRLLAVNLADDHLSAMNDPLYAPVPGRRWQTIWSSEQPDYGGGGTIPFVDVGRWLIRGVSAVLLGSAPAA
jgi:maltooligosyltrehalose trehalohydrolase